MMSSPFNSKIEIASRILLTLETRKPSPLNIDGLVVSDFVTVYAKEFDLSTINLHGNNEFSFSEFTLRRKQFETTIPLLVRQGLINVSNDNSGFDYSISEKGTRFINEINSEYAKRYRNLSKLAYLYTSGFSNNELLSLITRKASNALNWRND